VRGFLFTGLYHNLSTILTRYRLCFELFETLPDTANGTVNTDPLFRDLHSMQADEVDPFLVFLSLLLDTTGESAERARAKADEGAGKARAGSWFAVWRALLSTSAARAEKPVRIASSLERARDDRLLRLFIPVAAGLCCAPPGREYRLYRHDGCVMLAPRTERAARAPGEDPEEEAEEAEDGRRERPVWGPADSASLARLSRRYGVTASFEPERAPMRFDPR
jgi:hypothetical protein